MRDEHSVRWIESPLVGSVDEACRGDSGLMEHMKSPGVVVNPVVYIRLRSDLSKLEHPWNQIR
jgi:hypothetical protein